MAHLKAYLISPTRKVAATRPLVSTESSPSPALSFVAPAWEI